MRVEFIGVNLWESFNSFSSYIHKVLFVANDVLDRFVALLLLCRPKAFVLFEFVNGVDMADEISVFHELPLPVDGQLVDDDVSDHQEVGICSYIQHRRIYFK